jgi:hypothetical protein
VTAARVAPLVCCHGCARRIPADARREVIAGKTWCADCAAFVLYGFEAACLAVTDPSYRTAVAA